MGLPVKQFIASTNINDVVPEYLNTQVFSPRPSKQTISNAMDVGNPSNFVRMLDLYQHDFEALSNDILGYAFTDDETSNAIRHIDAIQKYLLDPHGAVGYLGLKKYFDENSSPDTVGIFLATAHPGKFGEVIEEKLQRPVDLPEKLKKFLSKEKQTVKLPNQFNALKDYLISA